MKKRVLQSEKTACVEGGKPQLCARDSDSVPQHGWILRSMNTRIRRVGQREWAVILRTFIVCIIAWILY